MAALLDAGDCSFASHQSAAWLWGLGEAPERHALTVPRSVSSHVEGAEVHRLTHMPVQLSYVRNLPCTNPLRTLVDLGAVTAGGALDEAVDRALARRLVTLEGLQAELGRVSKKGRNGTGRLRASLQRRGLTGAPNPSVLESKTIRLLRRSGIVPLAVEVVAGPDGRYRLDILLATGVAMEVDGFAYHATPEAKAYDERRRNEIRLSGVFLLVYTWTDIVGDGRRVLIEVHRAMSQRLPH